MDPDATLYELLQAEFLLSESIAAGDYLRAGNHANRVQTLAEALRSWTDRGGFAPGRATALNRLREWLRLTDVGDQVERLERILAQRVSDEDGPDADSLEASIYTDRLEREHSEGAHEHQPVRLCPVCEKG